MTKNPPGLRRPTSTLALAEGSETADKPRVDKDILWTKHHERRGLQRASMQNLRAGQKNSNEHPLLSLAEVRKGIEKGWSSAEALALADVRKCVEKEWTKQRERLRAEGVPVSDLGPRVDGSTNPQTVPPVSRPSTSRARETDTPSTAQPQTVEPPRQPLSLQELHHAFDDITSGSPTRYRGPRHAYLSYEPRNGADKELTVESVPQPLSPVVSQPKLSAEDEAQKYAAPFCKFMTANPTIFHVVKSIEKQLEDHGFTKLSERYSWELKKGGKYFVERNGSSLIAFAVGDKYEAGNGAAILAGHIDALTCKLKPISRLPKKAGYVQLGVAPYAGALTPLWMDRDLGVGGRVLVKESSGKIVSKVVKLDWPVAKIPTLAPHFGLPAKGPFNPETQMVPIIGLDNTGLYTAPVNAKPSILGGAGAFTATQPEGLVRAIAGELGVKDYSAIVNWELELFDLQPATLAGLDKEFISAGRIDDRLCSWSAIQALLESTRDANSGIIKAAALFDDEEIGSLLRQGARGNFLPTTIERIVDSFASPATPTLTSRTYANSFLVSSDVTHAVNPNFLGAYLENHSPRLNVGLVVSADSNGHMTTDAVSTAILQRCADKVGAKLQVFQIRNDVRSGGTVGPMLSAHTGIRAIDAGIPQLSMHSIRATTGSLDPGLGILAFRGFLDHFEEVDNEFS